MPFYHYTSLHLWKQMQESEDIGLCPNHSFLPHPRTWDKSKSPTEAFQHVLYGLHEAAPASWLSYKSALTGPYDNLLEELFVTKLHDPNSQGFVLLCADINPNDDIWVCDQAAYREGSVKAYWESLIPFTEWDANDSKIKIPELVCFDYLERQRVQFVQEISMQPSGRYNLQIDFAFSTAENSTLGELSL